MFVGTRSSDFSLSDLFRHQGNGGTAAHFTAASKFYFNWIPKDAITTLQPEGPSKACPSCVASISKFVLYPFDRSDVIPSASTNVAIHIPVLGNGIRSAYSYWLSYRTGYRESRNGISMHVTRLNLGGLYGAQFDSLNFDAHGNTTTTADSFVLPGTCYLMQPPGLLMDIDPSSVEQVQPLVCVDSIDVGNSITVSVSFPTPTTVPTMTKFKSVGKLECSVGGNNFGNKTLDVSSDQVHLVEYVGSGVDGNVTFSLCQESGPDASVAAYFYDA
jgi:hypothetical protein